MTSPHHAEGGCPQPDTHLLTAEVALIPPLGSPSPRHDTFSHIELPRLVQIPKYLLPPRPRLWIAIALLPFFASLLLLLSPFSEHPLPEAIHQWDGSLHTKNCVAGGFNGPVVSERLVHAVAPPRKAQLIVPQPSQLPPQTSLGSPQANPTKPDPTQSKPEPKQSKPKPNPNRPKAN